MVFSHIVLTAEIPSKAIEILQDPSIYKLGVHSRGDGAKLLRDYPEAFPKGIASLFELSKLARKADPVGTGPGAKLIALAKLVSAYLHKQLPKGAIRSSNWSLVLNKQQINCELTLPSLLSLILDALVASSYAQTLPMTLFAPSNFSRSLPKWRKTKGSS